MLILDQLMLTYAIGDIHGHLDKLQALHDLIARDRAAHGAADTPVVHLGDLVDRGPDSRGVIDWLMRGQRGGAPWIVLKGNHDRMFSGFLGSAHHQDPALRAGLHWFDGLLGGEQTLASYGVKAISRRGAADVHAEAKAAVPIAHAAFLDGLPASFRRGDCLFAHAGIRPGIALDRQTEDDLLWIRGTFLSDRREHGALVVHGHTPVERVANHGNRLNVDTGAGYGDPMSAVAIEGRTVWQLTPAGRVAVPIALA